MKRISAKQFFTVMWKGVCQSLGWFFGLFGYNRDGKFAKCVWGVFATSAAVIMASIAIYILLEAFYSYERMHHFRCVNPNCYANTYISQDIYFHKHDDAKGYIYNIRTGEKYIKHMEWIARPADKDSLICFCNGKKRGYFSRNSGKIVIEPKYNHAWVFSDGLASVEEDGSIKFIDRTGKVVIDTKMPYFPNMEGYMFRGGYCVVNTDDGELFGLMDKKGNFVLPLEYSHIEPSKNLKFWILTKGEEMAVLDRSLKPILPLSECSITIGDKTINVTMPDHTLRKYDMEGTLINDFYISEVRALDYVEFDKKEIMCQGYVFNDKDELVKIMEGPDHPSATARLRAYVAGDDYEGLMTADGHIVTMPLYWDIEALDYDLYLCTSENGDKVIVNGKGEIVK